MENSIIERFGSLEKEESLTCLESDLLIPGACLVEALSPFNGYYERYTHLDKPLYFYLVLDGHYSIEKIWRVILKVRKLFPHHFDAVPGTLEIFDIRPQVIRIRNIGEFKFIIDLQRLFAKEGLAYHKKIKKLTGEVGIIRLEKSFFLEPIGELMYMDAVQPHHGYFMIPRHYSWTEFKIITREVQLETGLLLFDAANAFFYENNGIIDMVRIYRERLDKEMLFTIMNRYFHFINDHISEAKIT